jgi:hypothetical protein
MRLGRPTVTEESCNDCSGCLGPAVPQCLVTCQAVTSKLVKPEPSFAGQTSQGTMISMFRHPDCKLESLPKQDDFSTPMFAMSKKTLTDQFRRMNSIAGG